MTSDLSPTLHVSETVAKGQKHAALIHRAFVSPDINVLLRAFLVYVRPLLKYSSIVCYPRTVKGITAIASVQRLYLPNVYLVLTSYVIAIDCSVLTFRILNSGASTLILYGVTKLCLAWLT